MNPFALLRGYKPQKVKKGCPIKTPPLEVALVGGEKSPRHTWRDMTTVLTYSTLSISK